MSSWAERVARALEEGRLYVTADEWAAIAASFDEDRGFSGAGYEVHMGGLPIVVDAAGAERQAASATRCLCVLSSVGPAFVSDRLCPVHGPEASARRLAAARHRLMADVLAGIRGDDALPGSSS